METLDPADWEAMRALAHRMVDDAIDYTASVRERPVWQPVPPEVAARLREPAPHEPQGAEAAYAEFPTRWARSIRGSGAGTWATAPSWVRWPISWPQL